MNDSLVECVTQPPDLGRTGRTNVTSDGITSFRHSVELLEHHKERAISVTANQGPDESHLWVTKPKNSSPKELLDDDEAIRNPVIKHASTKRQRKKKNKKSKKSRYCQAASAKAVASSTIKASHTAEDRENGTHVAPETNATRHPQVEQTVHFGCRPLSAHEVLQTVNGTGWSRPYEIPKDNIQCLKPGVENWCFKHARADCTDHTQVSTPVAELSSALNALECVDREQRTQAWVTDQSRLPEPESRTEASEVQTAAVSTAFETARGQSEDLRTTNEAAQESVVSHAQLFTAYATNEYGVSGTDAAAQLQALEHEAALNPLPETTGHPVSVPNDPLMSTTETRTNDRQNSQGELFLENWYRDFEMYQTPPDETEVQVYEHLLDLELIEAQPLFRHAYLEA